ncbi:TonB-dependent hemoglobin/transferrin/lactoferrin family receptor [Paroceanicella profunda]|uniref:TonB-dependent hemoglobin/transferrin/lactoferrin family receptor n=1 Tax=Paroceanicella profunda TaxID=2579971 RepID=A0A5B8FR61_9RHOB|nr:TonB-dependent hemoglobin/transferrin/lactoferrin family receptor [Paroceanicella profunda]QDL91196.1 TonB-dependent hemoglobin/transferrin/lactoferrin family receptor [Paroceanicella profunda]
MTLHFDQRLSAQRRAVALPLCLLAAAALPGVAVRAQEQDREIALDPIIVENAAPAPVGAPVEEVTAEQIARTPPRTASDLLRDVPNVTASEDPQNPGVNVNIRGLQDQTRVNMMIDGARQNFQQSGHGSTALVYIDPNMVRAVEVDKAVNATVGSAATLAGSVNFRTLRAEDLLEGRDTAGELIGTTGTNGMDFSGFAAGAARLNERLSLVFALSHRETGDYEIGRNGSVTTAAGTPFDSNSDVSFTGSDSWSGLGRATLDLSPASRVEIGYLGYRSEFGTGEGAYIDETTLSTSTGTLSWDYAPDDDLIDLSARLWITTLDSDEYRPPRPSYDSFSVDYALNTWGGSLSNTSRFAAGPGDVALTYGFEAFQDSTGTVSLAATQADDPDNVWFSGANPVGERDVASGFLSGQYDIGRWSLSAGLRYDAYSLSGTASTYVRSTDAGGTRTGGYQDVDVDSSGGRFVPSAGIAYEIADGLRLFTRYTEGYRPPTIMETVFGGQHIGFNAYFGPNPNLRPELSRTLEGGLTWEGHDLLLQDRFRLGATVFERRVSDYIGLATVYGSPAGGDDLSYSAYVNYEGTSRFQGVELSADYDAGGFYLRGSLATLDSDISQRYDAYIYDDRTSPAEGSTQASVVPPDLRWSLEGGVRVFDRVVELGGRVTHVSASENDLSSYNLDAFTTFDLYGSWQITETAALRLSVENLTDVAYVDPLGSSAYPAPGRTASLTLHMKF